MYKPLFQDWMSNCTKLLLSKFLEYIFLPKRSVMVISKSELDVAIVKTSVVGFG